MKNNSSDSNSDVTKSSHNLSKDHKENEVIDYLDKKIELTLRQHFFEGPIPNPITLREYEKTLPGAADRIIAMAEKQINHRHWVEKKALKDYNREIHIGQLLGF